MKNNSSVAVIIPSRIGSTRLPEKPILPIGDFTMIERVAKQALKSGYENIYVATDSDIIAQKAESAGVKYIMTDPEIPSGTDRMFAALQQIDNDKIEYAVNLQGDMPFIDPALLRGVIDHAVSNGYDITTPVVGVTKEIAQTSGNVKAVVSKNGKALYFSRSPVPYGAQQYNYHVGIYVFRKDALKKFVSMPVSQLEQSERLEQLRAMDNGMEIDIYSFAGPAPLSIDTKEDYTAALQYLKNHPGDE